MPGRAFKPTLLWNVNLVSNWQCHVKIINQDSHSFSCFVRLCTVRTCFLITWCNSWSTTHQPPIVGTCVRIVWINLHPPTTHTCTHRGGQLANLLLEQKYWFDFFLFSCVSVFTVTYVTVKSQVDWPTGKTHAAPDGKSSSSVCLFLNKSRVSQYTDEQRYYSYRFRWEANSVHDL